MTKYLFLLFLLMNTQKIGAQKTQSWGNFSFQLPEHWKAEENAFKTYQIYRLFEDKGQQNWLLINIKEQKDNDLDSAVQKFTLFIADYDDKFEIKKEERFDKNNAQINYFEIQNKEYKSTELYYLIAYKGKIYRQSYAFGENSPKTYVEEGIAIFNSLEINERKSKGPILQKIIKAPKRFMLKMLFMVQVRKMARIMKKASKKEVKE